MPMTVRREGPGASSCRLLREMRETIYQFRAPFVIDASKFQAAFGHLKPTPHGDAVQQTLAWYRPQ